MAKFESWFPSGQFDPRGGGEAGLPDFRKRRAEEAEFYARYGMSPAELKEAERLRGEYPGTLPAGQRPKGATPPANITSQQQGVLNRYGDFRSLLDTALGAGGRRAPAGGADEDERKRLEAMMGAYKGKVLSPQEEAEIQAIKKRWYQLSNIPMPEAGGEAERDWSIWKPTTWPVWGGKKTPPGSAGGLEGLE